ncbi:MAG: glycosyltransferase [Candidatus Cloacimonetes bacterium]|nr:glycosyltransferase [Candidatus Cloacimonadota bacterium]
MREKFNKNIIWIKDNANKCLIEKDGNAYDFFYNILPTNETEYPSLVLKKNLPQKKTENLQTNTTAEENITIHSQLYPSKEAEKIAQNTDFQNDTIVIVGFGLGYVSLKIREKYPEKKLILIEPDIKIFYLGLKHVDLSIIDFQKIYVGYEDASLASFWENPSEKEKDFDIYIQKSQERAYSSLFNRIVVFLRKKSTSSSLLNKININKTEQKTFENKSLKYKKFISSQCKIIFIDSTFILSKECLSAIKNTGNLLHYIHIDAENYDYDIFMKKLLNDITHFKPDFILTINHLGFDKEGRMADFFNDLEIPFVSWFVDSPNVILSSFEKNVSDFCNIFVWDDDYIIQVKEKGYKNCDFLPLATDTSIFYPQKSVSTDYKYSVSFVGSSMTNAVHKTMKSWVHRDDLLSIFGVIVEKFLTSKSRHVENAFSDMDLRFDSITQREDFIAAILWKGTQIYRKSGLDKLSNFMPIVSGDPNWKNILPIEFEILSERWYYDDLCDFYNQSKINFNMTSLQMTNAVNQRVFDVSASRQFLLTDYRPQISHFFATKENMVWFDDVDEIPDILDFYLKNDLSRKKIAENSYQIVIKKHTYQHRINEMIDILRKRYK